MSGDEFLEGRFNVFMGEHAENMKMAVAHGNLEKALRVVFDAGYNQAIKDVYSTVQEDDQSEYGI